jgi:hypothetical protein
MSDQLKQAIVDGCGASAQCAAHAKGRHGFSYISTTSLSNWSGIIAWIRCAGGPPGVASRRTRRG